MSEPAWMERKACTPADAGLFWPAPGEGHAMDFTAGLAICARCPVMYPCRADAIAHGDISDGHTTQGQVVGGCAPKERVKGERPMYQCYREGCVTWFAKRQGANMYCSPACVAEVRRESRAGAYRRRRGAA